MKSIKKVVLGAVGIFAVAALFAGCGGGEKTADMNSTIIVGTEATYPPFEFTEDHGDKIQGFDKDIMDAIAKKEGLKVEWKNMGFDGLIPALKSNQINAAIAGINITPERQKVVAFSEPYYETSSVVIHLKGDGITDMKDLEGKTIAVQIGTAQAEEAKMIPGATVKEFNIVPDILNELKVKGCDAAMVDGPLAGYYTKKDPNQFAAFKTGGEAQPIAIAVNADNKELLEKFNKGLAAIKADGQYKEISDKWFGGLEIK